MSANLEQKGIRVRAGSSRSSARDGTFRIDAALVPENSKQLVIPATTLEQELQRALSRLPVEDRFKLQEYGGAVTVTHETKDDQGSGTHVYLEEQDPSYEQIYTIDTSDNGATTETLTEREIGARRAYREIAIPTRSRRAIATTTFVFNEREPEPIEIDYSGTPGTGWKFVGNAPTIELFGHQIALARLANFLSMLPILGYIFPSYNAVYDTIDEASRNAFSALGRANSLCVIQPEKYRGEILNRDDI